MPIKPDQERVSAGTPEHRSSAAAAVSKWESEVRVRSVELVILAKNIQAASETLMHLTGRVHASSTKSLVKYNCCQIHVPDPTQAEGFGEPTEAYCTTATIHE